MTRVDTLRGQLATSLVRMTELQQRAESTASRDPTLPRAFDELQRALAELETAVDELREQNSRLQAARDEAEMERSRWEAMFDAAPLPYLLTDRQAIIRNVNDAGAALLAMTRRFLVGKPLALFVDGGRAEFLSQVSNASTSDTPASVACMLRPRERAPFLASASVHRFPLPDGQPGLWWIFK